MPTRRHAHTLVTGGSSGIGFAIARCAAREGHAVTLVARGADRLAEAAESIGVTNGGRVQTIVADVALRANAEGCVHAAVSKFGTPTCVVNAAGQAVPGYFTDLSVDAFETMSAVNYLGTMYVTKTAYPLMRANGGGQIALIASGTALTGVFGYTAYAASKCAVRGFGECLRPEARRDNITITVAYPPDTDTPQLAAENLIKPLETKAIAAAGSVWPADRVGERIWKAIKAGRFSVAPGWEMSALLHLHSLIDPILQRSFDRIADRATARAHRR